VDQYIKGTFTLTKQSFAEQGENINQRKRAFRGKRFVSGNTHSPNCLPVIINSLKTLHTSTCNLATKIEPPLFRENHWYFSYSRLHFCGIILDWRYKIKKIQRVYPAWRQAGFARTRDISIVLPILKQVRNIAMREKSTALRALNKKKEYCLTRVWWKR